MPSHPLPPSPEKPHHYFSSDLALFSPSDLAQLPSLPVNFIGFQLQFLTGAGVFSRSEMDEGSQLLLQTMKQLGDFPDTARVCDLGCGWGAIAAMWAKAHPKHEVFAVDINPRAAQLTHINLQRNEIEDACVWCADGLSATRGGNFDVIVCNPPIRAGNRVIESLFDDALRCLKANGELWAVIRTAQGAKSWAKKLEALFGACETVEMRAGFRILRAVKS